jgi:hypothetical protein
MSTTRATAILLLVAGLLASGCGSSAKKADPADDLALIRHASLTAADLPGYSGSKHDATDDVPACIRKSFAECMKVPATVFDDTPNSQRVDSDNFSKGEAAVSSELRIYSAQSDVDDRWQQVAKPATGPCLARLFENGAKLGADAGVTFGASSGTQFEVGVGARSVGYSVKLTLTADKETTVFYADVVFAQRGRAVVSIESVDVGAPSDRALQIGLVQKVYDRLGA